MKVYNIVFFRLNLPIIQASPAKSNPKHKQKNSAKKHKTAEIHTCFPRSSYIAFFSLLKRIMAYYSVK